MCVLTIKNQFPKTNIETITTYLVKLFAYLEEEITVSDATKRLRKEYLVSFQMRNWISCKLAKLSSDQVKKLYGMVKDWTGEEADFKKGPGGA